ncbi:10355_t:CDS:2 [Funneliformis mosseae]|uniref:Kinetochore protein Spc24 n=1 Tax=Funneliformis mosseae TaxID=27381 RepID=A0A9N9EHW5_FUNMO|nr:10355_t:CDS:2 [Funneliformis mosseae]
MEHSDNIINEIVALKNKFNSDEQTAILKEIAQNVRKFEEITNQKSEKLRNELRTLNRKLTTIQASTKKTIEQNEAGFNDLMVKYEREKFDLDESITQLDAEEKYPLELEELENMNIEDETLPKDDITSLQLHVYRKLGIQFIEDEETHELKARIESPDNNDIHTLVIDDRHSQYFMTNHLWELSTGS